jgi:Flp pilus assembly protein TadB
VNYFERRVQEYRQDAIRQRFENDLAENMNEGTNLSWLWAFLCGPLYYVVHGFWGRAALVLVLNFVLIGFFVSPFLAAGAWRQRAQERARGMIRDHQINRQIAAENKRLNELILRKSD